MGPNWKTDSVICAISPIFGRTLEFWKWEALYFMTLWHLAFTFSWVKSKQGFLLQLCQIRDTVFLWFGLALKKRNKKINFQPNCVWSQSPFYFSWALVFFGIGTFWNMVQRNHGGDGRKFKFIFIDQKYKNALNMSPFCIIMCNL